MTNEKGILCISDLHCGSIYGLLPANFVTSDGAPKLQNPGQAYLWECWKHLCAKIFGLPIVAVVVNGDVVDGLQQLSAGSEFALPLLADQAEAAKDTLMQLKTAAPQDAKWLFTAGTEYHDSKAAREVEVVAEALDAKRYNGLGTGRHCREVLDLEIDGVVSNFAHGISVSGGLYRTTAPDREGLWSALAGKEGQFPRADAVIRSHAHYFTHVEHESKHICITPCWQLQTRHMRKRSVYRMIPSIGAVIVWVDGEAKKSGEDPIRVQKILYKLPKIGTTKL